ncbi:MAG TPA: hypothetical protein DCR97_12415 [Deltaproteobacteria bacterium]|nr:hypothetical protein [Deltaproteobacteria bacterium]
MKILLINPYIYDVSAYGFWSAPLGLLYMGSIMRMNGADVRLLDCLRVDDSKGRPDGRAPFLKKKVENPSVVRGVGKRFRRYGLSPEEVSRELRAMEEPDLVMITCIMTYWYLGAREIIDLVKDAFPTAKIVVGGNYATLCYEHAVREMRHADLVVRSFEAERFYRWVQEKCNFPLAAKLDPMDLTNLPYPCFDLYGRCRFVPLLTSVGCVYRCSYCATAYLQPKMIRRETTDVIEEIRHWHGLGIERFVLYDDGFLFQKESHAKPLLRGIRELPFEISVYNPNALNATMVDRETAALLKEGGFREVRLGFETSDPGLQKRTGGKVRTEDLERAVDWLWRAGFVGSQVVVYVLTGLPGQRHEGVRATIDYLQGLGVRVHLAQYSPIPHSRLYDEHRGEARFPISEPMFQNNALFPFEWEGFTEGDLNALKQLVREYNGGIGDGEGDEREE